MADKKFGQKRVCPHCEKKFYDLNKKSPYKCPCGEKDIVIDEELSFYKYSSQSNSQRKQSLKMNLQTLKMQIMRHEDDDECNFT